MTDATDIFSDTLALFGSEDALAEPPTEVRYGPIQSRIVSRSHLRVMSVVFILVSDSSLIMRERDSKCSLHRSSIAD